MTFSRRLLTSCTPVWYAEMWVSQKIRIDSCISRAFLTSSGFEIEVQPPSALAVSSQVFEFVSKLRRDIWV